MAREDNSYDPSLDDEVATFLSPEEDYVARVISYNGGERKIELCKMGSRRPYKVGRMTLAQATILLPLMEKAIAWMARK